MSGEATRDYLLRRSVLDCYTGSPASMKTHWVKHLRSKVRCSWWKSQGIDFVIRYGSRCCIDVTMSWALRPTDTIRHSFASIHTCTVALRIECIQHTRYCTVSTVLIDDQRQNSPDITITVTGRMASLLPVIITVHECFSIYLKDEQKSK